MTFPELIGSNTLTNTRNNNNIAWRNVHGIRITPATSTSTLDTFTWTARPGALSKLAIEPVAGMPGTVVLDLGGLFDGWKKNGANGSGFTVIGPTQLLISTRGGDGGGRTCSRAGPCHCGAELHAADAWHLAGARPPA